MQDSGCPFNYKSSEGENGVGDDRRESTRDCIGESSQNDFHWRSLLIKPILGKNYISQHTNTDEITSRDSCSSSRVTNKDNMMPHLSNAATTPSHMMLSTTRQMSTIPKTGASHSFWVYPSSLQFFKAMELKQKEPANECIDEIVDVHNFVNEEAWKKILEWEKMHEKTCKTPSLTRFIGRYNDLSIKARWNQYFTHLGKPFDRHDWFVDRCGVTVRYIIDYYDDQRKKDVTQVSLDVRPAPDSLTAISDRIRRPFWEFFSRRRKQS